MKTAKMETIYLTCTGEEMNALAERMEKGIESNGSFAEVFRDEKLMIRFTSQTSLEPRRIQMIRIEKAENVITVSGNPEQFRQLASKLTLKEQSSKLGESLEVASFAAGDGASVLTILAQNG